MNTLSTLSIVRETEVEYMREDLYRPHQFRIARTEDRETFEALLRSRSGIQIYDTLLAQLRDLIRTRNPKRKLDATELEVLLAGLLGGTPPMQYGVWIYYPWSGRMVHLLDEAEFIELRTNRNCYKITPAEQAVLAHKHVGVIGLSVGQSVALNLALERSCGELRLADFDRLDLSNLNRIRTGVHNLGIPKVCITAREIAEIDPYLHVTCFPDGITEDNVDSFLLGSSPLDVVVEECDSLDIKVLLRHHARIHRIPVVMDTCDRGMIDVERFDQDPERAIFHGLIQGVSVDSLRGLTTEEKVPFVLRILGVESLTPRIRASMMEIEQSISTWPQLASAVAHGGAAAADVVRRISLGEPVLSGRYYLDLEKLVPAATVEDRETASDQDRQKPVSLLSADAMLAAIRHLPPVDARAGVSLNPELLSELVTDATLAPSGGNCQPWRWACDGCNLFLFHDVVRSQIAWDSEGLAGLIALGASIENLALSSTAAGLTMHADVFPSAENQQLVARLQFSRSDENHAGEEVWRSELYPLLRIRTTNRKLGVRRLVPSTDMKALSEAARSIDGADVCWLTADEELEECGSLMGAADRVVFLTEQWSRSLLNEIRWTPQEVASSRDGIPLETLEFSPVDEAGLKLCRDQDVLKFVRSVGGGLNLEKASRKAIAGAAAVGLITMPLRTPHQYFLGGRAVQRLWLTATECRLALHPMTSLPYLLMHVEAHGTRDLDQEIASGLRLLQHRYSRLFAAAVGRAHVFLFRISHAEETTHRAPRRDLDEILTML
jgi:molybdopterin/thiamine biosynthesis adenylyltransferase